MISAIRHYGGGRKLIREVNGVRQVYDLCSAVELLNDAGDAIRFNVAHEAREWYWTNKHPASGSGYSVVTPRAKHDRPRNRQPHRSATAVEAVAP